MPKLRAYKDGSGFYIRTAFAGKNTPKGKQNIVTYQVTPAGENYLKHPGFFSRPRGDGSEISREELISMYKRGYLTTERTGPGLIERLPPKRIVVVDVHVLVFLLFCLWYYAYLHTWL